MGDQAPLGRSSSPLRWIIGILFVALAGWLAAGTEWSLLFDKEALLRGITVVDPRRSGEGACEAGLDVASLSARPSRVMVRRASGDETIEMNAGLGRLAYPEGSGPVELRLTFEGMLRKPSHADITLAQEGCRLQATSFRSMPILPF